LFNLYLRRCTINNSIKKVLEFIAELEDGRKLNDHEIADYAQWAGRLVALGHSKPIADFCERFSPETINNIVKKRAEEGTSDLDEAYGEYLAVEIFTAQDFYCFMQYSPIKLSDDTIAAIKDWVTKAVEIPLDSEAVATLDAYYETYPIEDKDIIG